ncbi:hypothetical protein UFOVP500_21 [uncultured Caudovirales phage]|uniref:DUF7483 domain-containing protein n=1 Tax=uncultured Caudovirales phage TaxID=2100421 RepID=A0A6J5MN75_9CAUD|nr:hypothetical protein UFOVP500_21 [uncultured Caudovirales phage]
MMTTVVTRGAASAQALGYASSSAAVNYIEDVFSTFLYTGNGSTQTITNGIDLSGKGGLVWNKDRNNANGHILVDSAVGLTKYRKTESTAADSTTTAWIFNSNGYVIPVPFGNIDNQVSWTFREQPKFFDIVTYTGTGANRTIAHSLGSVPGMIIVKRTDAVANWQVYHRSLANTQYMVLNTTAAAATGATRWNSTTPTDSVFSLGTDTTVNASGGTYVAYLYAHNAGGFGLTGTDNVISCGSYVGTSSSGNEVTLGYEPQWVLVKGAGNTFDWYDMDVIRGMNNTNTYFLAPNTSAAESNFGGAGFVPTATGFRIDAAGSGLNASGVTYIYIAIRRGPMKVPTSGTSVFSPIYSAAAANTVLTTSFPVDLQIPAYTGATIGRFVVDRLRGVVTTAVDAATSPWMKTNATDAETTGFNITRAWDNTGYQIPQYLGGATTVYFNFRRAPGFFDEVCYTGTGSAGATYSHNLGSVPELMLFKCRSAGQPWTVYSAATGNTKIFDLSTTAAAVTDTTVWNSTSPTSSIFTVGASGFVNGGGTTYVAYLFATLAGVSKVGSYTGTGTTQTINCGFTAGARFVLIKRTDSTGDWYVWDSARGIVAGNDPHLSLNTTAAEVTTDDSVDTDSTGFVVNQVAATNINVTSASYIFLAVS